ncbi:MAG TPA: hypothetical protein VMQ10_06275 [Spirochaetia bacterium]|nr:hypothetical protein [Spirochaetia bacterium]
MKGLGPRRWRMAPALIALGIFLLLLSGCPFSSEHPLSDPASALPEKALVGQWRMQDPDSGEWHTLSILPFDEHQMVAVTVENDRGKVSGFRLFVTAVGPERFLNLQELGTSDPAWFFARFEVDRDHLRLQIVDDTLFEKRSFASAAELTAFVRAHLSDPRLYAAEDETPSVATLERVAAQP